ncbi:MULTISPECIES: glutamate-5-semialdehyde dehydrogenase [unclassified Desulfovibrio]|uniref:glutamate-5-semialdehyde dehydrogenase n=1 Tax=unclassified Desulfovibrio TaxID=2593640 RepID=UPI000F5EE416|nr:MULTISPECIES: glutamate-5-semialdehyde dehydrogenase [unclassified Desulfovibrio]RRD71239.1 glutamate-5-semialdehyde dehydrogenase [Desulfovibrio sp. OH1209_COT-279]RRD87527.1 glutamate-5-semialdehyde dehydrogenase [Desulfovibrio sp. OH1186_COT-070]
MTDTMTRMGAQAKEAARIMARIHPDAKVRALQNLDVLLQENAREILDANTLDVSAARAAGQDAPRLNRLTLTPTVLEEMRAACRYVAQLPDPVGATERQWQQPNGLLVGRMRIPLGVIAMIYEARPNVTIEAAILCIKAGNAVILRGGSEALRSNTELIRVLRLALERSGLPTDAAQLVSVPGHEAVTHLCRMDRFVDVVIPRGGEGLVRAVTEAATVPVLKHYKGVCHAFVDADADPDQALEIVFNGKVQRPGVCNALECLLVHKDCAPAFLPRVGEKLGAAGVEFRACPRSLPLLGATAVPQRPEDLGQEFHALVLAVCVVDTLDAALDHIARHGSNHTEVICTNNHAHAMRFLREADASLVAVNASSRFNDGGQLGLGAEIGISTSKLHAYGPMGVEELTTTKFVVLGQGQVRQ